MAEELKTSRDGTPTGEMVAEWLRANGYDGLCNPDAGCGCGLDDLMPCNQASDSFCVCAPMRCRTRRVVLAIVSTA